MGFFVLSFLCIFGIWLAYPFVIDFFLLDADITDNVILDSRFKGSYGDQFGALSALFSGFAFAGIIYTILLQRKDLLATRAEVERQNKISEKQMFENTLFQMLFSRQDILKDLDILGDKGRKALDNYFEKVVSSDNDFVFFRSLMKLDRDQVREIDESGDVESLSDFLESKDISTIRECLESRKTAIGAYLDADKSSQYDKLKKASYLATNECMNEISHYLRYTFWIYKNIDQSDILNEDEKLSYASIVRSQLSDVEVATIFYSVVIDNDLDSWSDTPISITEMKRLALRFKVVESLNDSFLIHSTHKDLLKK